MLLNEVWNAEEPIGSGPAWRILNDKGIKVNPDARTSVSRATVIMFLDRMVDDGVLGYTEASGKGGYHKLYFPKVSREKYPEYVVKQIVEGLMRTFPRDPLVLKVAKLIGI